MITETLHDTISTLRSLTLFIEKKHTKNLIGKAIWFLKQAEREAEKDEKVEAVKG
jgi:hypothetical protein